MANSLGRHGEVIKVCDRVSLGPHPHSTRVFERVIGRLNYLLPIKKAADLVPNANYSQLVPLLWRDRDVGARELAAPSIYDVVDITVVLKRVCPNDVVIVFIPVAKDQSACFIDATTHRLELDAQFQILEYPIIQDSHWKAI